MKTALFVALAVVCGAAFAQSAPSSSALNAALAAPPMTSQGVIGVALGSESPQSITATPGAMNTVYAFVTVLMFADFPGLHAAIVATTPRPVLYVKSARNPTDALFLVRTKENPKDGNRSVKLGNAKFAGYSGINTPDKDWRIPCAVAEVSPGVWSMTPTIDLPPGEYGLFAPVGTYMDGIPATSTGGALYGFAVTSSPAVATGVP